MSHVPGGLSKDCTVSTQQEQLAAAVLGAASCASSREVVPQADVLLAPVCVTATAPQSWARSARRGHYYRKAEYPIHASLMTFVSPTYGDRSWRATGPDLCQQRVGRFRE